MKKFEKKSLSTFIAMLITIVASLVPTLANAHGDSNSENISGMHDHEDNPTLAKVMFDQLEFRNGGGDNQFVMDAQAWIGKDLNKFWLKADIEQSDGETEEAELHALYSRAITSYWDLQIGLREDIKPKPTDSWGVIGVHGLAPYFFELDAAFFVGESGDTAARFSAEYELLFTQRLILSPEFEFNLYGQRDTRKMTGAGLSDVNAGLRLRYEIFREFAPYIGVHWNKKFGETADFSRISDEATSDTQVVAGIRAWF